jgi:hypothetical protein
MSFPMVSPSFQLGRRPGADVQRPSRVQIYSLCRIAEEIGAVVAASAQSLR